MAVSKQACVSGIFIGSTTMLMAQDAGSMAQENADLKARVTALEQMAQKEGLLPSGTPAPRLVSAMSDMTISGYVQASYFYNTRRPADGNNVYNEPIQFNPWGINGGYYYGRITVTF